jgi:hypothetical protein
MKKSILYFAVAVISSVLLNSCAKDSSTADVGAQTTGKGGSTSRFSIVGDYLYTIDSKNLKVFRISELANPVFLSNISLGIGIETIFALNGNLLIGASDGMYIYDIAQPQSPLLRTKYQHIRQCDPVVANDSIAFVTLRSVSNNSPCGPITWGVSNVLEVVDIRNLNSPELIQRYPMNNPYGIGIDKNLLFVCDAGVLRVMDISNPYANIPEISTLAINVDDVIPLGTHLLAVGSNAVYDIDYSDPTALRIVAQIKRASNALLEKDKTINWSKRPLVYKIN